MKSPRFIRTLVPLRCFFISRRIPDPQHAKTIPNRISLDSLKERCPKHLKRMFLYQIQEMKSHQIWSITNPISPLVFSSLIHITSCPVPSFPLISIFQKPDEIGDRNHNIRTQALQSQIAEEFSIYEFIISLFCNFIVCYLLIVLFWFYQR